MGVRILEDGAPSTFDRSIIGERFGRLVVEEYAGPGGKYIGALVRCRCDCGNETVVPAHSLKRGNTRSCGCGERENKEQIQENFTRMRVEDWDGKGHTNIANLDSKPYKRNKSGIRGVFEYKGKWRAYVTVRRKTYRLGTYHTIEAAAHVRRKAERAVFDIERESHGFPPTDEEAWRKRLADVLGELRDEEKKKEKNNG